MLFARGTLFSPTNVSHENVFLYWPRVYFYRGFDELTATGSPAGGNRRSQSGSIGWEKAEQIVEALNADLAATYVLYHQLRKHHWNAAGPQYRELHHFWGKAAEDAEYAADELAERVQALDDVPISEPAMLE